MVATRVSHGGVVLGYGRGLAVDEDRWGATGGTEGRLVVSGERQERVQVDAEGCSDRAAGSSHVLHSHTAADDPWHRWPSHRLGNFLVGLRGAS